MNFKENISLDDRINFVNAVMQLCSINDEYEPALFDYGFRVSVLMFFTNEGSADKGIEDLNQIVYQPEFTEFINHSEVVKSLFKACREKIDTAREQAMVKYKMDNDPLSKLVDVIAEISKQFDMEKIIKEVAAENSKRPIMVGDPAAAKAERAKRETAKRKSTKKKAQDIGLKVLANPDVSKDESI